MGPDAFPPFGPPAALPTVSGTVVEQHTGLPLGGVPVRWAARGADTEAAWFELGSALTAADGSFAITPADTADMRQAVCSLSWQAESRSVFLVEAGDAQPLEFPLGPAVDGELHMLRLAGEGPGPDAPAWVALGGFLAANRMVRVEDLGGQLLAPPADSPVQAWPPLARAAALARVARVLDADPSQQSHLLNLDALREGDLDKAVSNFKNAGMFEQYGGQPDDWLFGSYFKLPKSDLELYRDYLVGVWVGAARQMHGVQPGSVDDALRAQLHTRFHQDFATGDVAEQDSHALLIPLLQAVLTAPADRDGFGLAAGAIVARAAGQSDADYVAALVAQTGQSAAELRNRFRMRFERPPGERSSPVALNVETLLGLLADTWQSPEEPFPTALRGLQVERPLIFAPYVGRAPFFLQYEEWLDRQRRFYPENVYDVRRVLPNFFKEWRDVMAGQKTALHPNINPYNDYIASQADWNASAQWVERMFGITDEIRLALSLADKQDVQGALAHLATASGLIDDARHAAPMAWTRGDFVWYDENGYPPLPAQLKLDRRVSLKSRATLPVSTREQLAAFEAYFDTRTQPHTPGWAGGPQPGQYDWLESWVARARTLYVHELDYLQLVLIPYLRSTIQLTQGDFAGGVKALGRITGYEVGVGELATAPGYRAGATSAGPYFHQEAGLPYTAAVAFDPDTKAYTDQVPLTGWWEGARSPGAAAVLAPFEQRFFKLAQGDAMLAWADELYRADDPSSIRRARELYKGVLFLHGDDPEIAPHFPRPGLLYPGLPFDLGGGLLGNPVIAAQVNPARASQIARARAGFGQIEMGLNAYGYRDDMVPLLRYKPLKLAADLFAASAKSAQSDFLNYQTRFELATIEGWQTAAMLKKAQAGAGIAEEQVAIAQAGVAKAKEQVAAVQAQIDAKKKEIADADSFFGQAKDFFGGMKDSLSGLASAAQGVMADGAAAGSVSGGDLVAMLGKSSGGASAAKDALTSTLGSGAGMTFAFGAFAYYGYTTMDGMAQAAAQRSSDLKSLEEVALKAAQAQVVLKERDVTIARYGQQIAAAELELARTLDRFQRERFLNVDLWNKLAAFAQRTMKRYVELGARAAWMAERALAFEQLREVRIVRMNYLPWSMRGVTGADRLQLDLAELEAQRLNGIRLTMPVKHTYSLARDFPIAFGSLKKSGRCAFHTREALLQAVYPGSFAYRVRAVTVAAQDADGPPARGILRNLGASSVAREDGAAPQLLVRFPDALPLSEFRLHQDLWVYGMPGETLLQFEGSGIETDWELEFPVAANPKGTRTLTDVLVTVDMNAMYSQALAAQAAAAAAAGAVPVTRSIALAASMWDPRGLAALHDKNQPARLRFDIGRLALPRAEKNRKLANLALLAVGTTRLVYDATLKAETSAVQADFEMKEGLALSNAGPLLGSAPALPLNGLVGLPLDQAFVLTLDRTGVQDEIGALQDVVLWVEYGAQV